MTISESEAAIDRIRSMPNGTVLTADGSGRRLVGPQRLMRTGGVFHFVNEVGTGVYAYDIDVTTIRDVIVPPYETNR